ncbi:MAG: hypothetical protein ABSF80_07285 [Chitinispirillaceae bacterium]|jgi:hypothetical protein
MNDSVNKYTKEKEKEIWFSEFMTSLSQDTFLAMEQILVNHHPKLSKQSYSDFISDTRLICNGRLTLYGIYSFEPENDFIIWADKILRYMKDDLLKNKDIKRILTFAEISKELKIPLFQLKICFQLIGRLPIRNYFNVLNISKNRTECLTVGYANSDILNYESITSLFDDLYNTKKTPEENGDDIITEEVESSSEFPRVNTSYKMTDTNTIQALEERFNGKKLTPALLGELEKITKDAEWSDKDKAEIFGVKREWYSKRRIEWFGKKK